MIEIKEPIWHGDLAFDKRSITIAEYRLQNEGRIVEIHILHRRKNGIITYPSIYEMELNRIIKYPKVYINGNERIVGYEIPIKDLRIKQPIQVTKIINCPLNNNKTEVLAVQKGLWED